MGNRSSVPYVLILAATAVLCYANTLSVPFIFDDVVNITENPHVRSLWPLLSAFQAPWYSSLAGRPLAAFSFALNYAFSGLDVWSYHLVNISILFLEALTLFGVMRHALRTEKLRSQCGHAVDGLALGTALLWMAHPLHTQAITYVTQRLESLMGLFFVLTLYLAIRGWESGARLRWHGLAMLCCLAGALVKEVMVMAPFMVLAYESVFVRKGIFESLRRSKLLYAGLCLSFIPLVIHIVWGSQWVNGPGHSTFTYLEYVLTQPEAFLRYFRLAFMPTGLCLDYRWPATPLLTAIPLGMLFLGLVGASVWAFLRGRPVGFLGVWFWGVLAPTSLMVLPDAVVEYRVHVSLMALSAFVVVGGYLLLCRYEKQHLGKVMVLLVVLALAGATVVRNMDYNSDISIWDDTARKRPENSRAYANLARAILLQDKKLQAAEIQEAIALLEESIRLDPTFPIALVNLGIAKMKLGQDEEAMGHFSKALSFWPHMPVAHTELGMAHLKRGEADKALPHYEFVIQVNPVHPGYHSELALVYHALGKHKQALEHFQKATELAPDNAAYLTNLCVMQYKLEQKEEAAVCFSKALALDPESTVAQKYVKLLGAKE